MTPQHYPLQWPPGWPRTDKLRRESGRFQTTLAAALTNLKKQIELMGGKSLVLSSNVTLGHDRPDDCGVVAYFMWNQKQLAIPCDRWQRVEHNVQAIALTVEAMRGMERWGAKQMIEAMFTGFKALPAATGRHWSEVLGVSRGESIENIATAYRARSKVCHPDVNGGKREAWDELEAAYQTAKAERGF